MATMDRLVSHSGLELMPREESLRLLASQTVGRLAFVDGDQPLIVPVNYALVDGLVVFRSGEGTKLETVPGAKVAFEVDQFDDASRTGWSVVVQGSAEDITEDADWFAARARAGAPETWAPGSKDHCIRIVPTRVSGRRIGPHK